METKRGRPREADAEQDAQPQPEPETELERGGDEHLEILFGFGDNEGQRQIVPFLQERDLAALVLVSRALTRELLKPDSCLWEHLALSRFAMEDGGKRKTSQTVMDTFQGDYRICFTQRPRVRFDGIYFSRREATEFRCPLSHILSPSQSLRGRFLIFS